MSLYSIGIIKNSVKILMVIILMACNTEKQNSSVLIFTGSNNHHWQSTDILLSKILSDAGIFDITTTTRPDTLTKNFLSQFDVVVSNWNSWPKNDYRLPFETENAFIEFIENGGGFVTFHSSTSVFYAWPEFQNITTAAWLMDSTSHGKPSEIIVSFSDLNHPATKGLTDFTIFDELWINASKNNRFEILGTARSLDNPGNVKNVQPAVMVSEYGKGKIFHTILGHDTIAMKNPGFQNLLIKGMIWAKRKP
jgi:type 1 glutamine amidotransferase